MAKKVKLTEADLNRIVKKVIEEQNFVQDAKNAVTGTLKAGANAINNATGGVAGKVLNKAVNTAKSVGNAVNNALTIDNSSRQQALRSGGPEKARAVMANQKIQALAKTLKQYTPHEITAAQKLNATGGVSPTPARPTQAVRPTPTKPVQTTQSLVQSAQKAAQVKQV